MLRLDLPARNLRTQVGDQSDGWLRNLIIRNTLSGQWMVILQVCYDQPTWLKAVFDVVIPQFPQVTTWHYVINGKGNDTFHDLDVQTYQGPGYITEQMEEFQFRIGPKSFFQTNAAQALELYRITRRMAGLTGNELVYDLYTGTGTIGLFVSKQARQVVGVEYVEAAVVDARVNAEINNIAHASFFAGDMAKVLTPGFIDTHGRPDVVITDPPRGGMEPDVVQRLLEAQPSRIVYVSCNPATQARDLALLDPSYHITEVQPVDMFPQTDHVESVVRLELR
jgi:23S rRNA (uracil1939-C5)-methyltransferase